MIITAGRLEEQLCWSEPMDEILGTHRSSGLPMKRGLVHPGEGPASALYRKPGRVVGAGNGAVITVWFFLNRGHSRARAVRRAPGRGAPGMPGVLHGHHGHPGRRRAGLVFWLFMAHRAGSHPGCGSQPPRGPQCSARARTWSWSRRQRSPGPGVRTLSRPRAGTPEAGPGSAGTSAWPAPARRHPASASDPSAPIWRFIEVPTTSRAATACARPPNRLCSTTRCATAAWRSRPPSGMRSA